jgi:hypothetical protein
MKPIPKQSLAVAVSVAMVVAVAGAVAVVVAVVVLVVIPERGSAVAFAVVCSCLSF